MKRIVRLSGRWVDRLMDRMLAVVCALILCQGPAFYEAYVVRLAGHAAEARANLAGWERVAVAGGFSGLDELRIAYLDGGANHLVATGLKVAEDLTRSVRHQRALDALRGASAWRRPWVLMREGDVSVMAAVARDFTPVFPLTIEAAVYALLGMLLGVGAYSMAKRMVRGCGRILRRVCRRRTPDLQPLDDPQPHVE